MNIREEFEKAFDETPASAWTPKAMALWAAKWAMERCAKEAKESLHPCTSAGRNAQSHIIGKIRQLAKELQ